MRKVNFDKFVTEGGIKVGAEEFSSHHHEFFVPDPAMKTWIKVISNSRNVPGYLTALTTAGLWQLLDQIWESLDSNDDDTLELAFENGKKAYFTLVATGLGKKTLQVEI